MTEPLKFFPAFQARQLEKIQRDFSERFRAAENQRQLKVIRDDYHLALAAIGIDSAIPEATVLVDKTIANENPRPVRGPATKAFCKSAVMAVAVVGCGLLSFVYLFLAIRSSLSYLARRVYHRRNSA